MEYEDVVRIAAETYRKMSIISHDKKCPICKKEVTTIGVNMVGETNSSQLGFESESYLRCLGCLTLFEEKLIVAPKTMTITFPAKQGAKVKTPRVKLTPK